MDGGGDYLIVVKKNQETLYQDIESCFARAEENDYEGVKWSSYNKVEDGHGRREGRNYVVIENPEWISEKEKWPKLTVIGRCYSGGKEGEDERTFHTRYFIGSKLAKARYARTKAATC